MEGITSSRLLHFVHFLCYSFISPSLSLHLSLKLLITLSDQASPLLPPSLNRMTTITLLLTNGMTTTTTIVVNCMHHHHPLPLVLIPSLSILPSIQVGGEGTKHHHPHVRRIRRLLLLIILPHSSIDLYQEVLMILPPCPNLTFYSSHHHHRHSPPPTSARVATKEEERQSTKTQSSINSSVSYEHTNHPSKWSKWKAMVTASSVPSPSKSTVIKACMPKSERTVSTLWNEMYLTFKTLLPTKDSINTLLVNDKWVYMEITRRFRP